MDEELPAPEAESATCRQLSIAPSGIALAAESH